MKKTLAIVISALNEERNIGALLEDILHQEFSEQIMNSFALTRILVTSDGSTDNTSPIVNSFRSMDSRVELIENPKRIGKIFSLNNAFRRITEDYCILFDADVRLQKNTLDQLIRPFTAQSFDLIGGNPVPVPPKRLLNVAEQASMFSWHLAQEIKNRHPESIYSAHGRILMLSRKLYASLKIDHLSTPGDDQFIYLKCEHNFAYAASAKITYRLPSTIGDYLKQNVRFRMAKLTRARNLDTEQIDKEFYISDRASILVKTITLHPLRFILWSILYTAGFLRFTLFMKHKRNLAVSQIWGEVMSTK